MHKSSNIKAYLALAFMLAFIPMAHAGALDPVLDMYKPYQKTWYQAIHVYAERLFWMLAGIDLSWWAICAVLDKSDEMKSFLVSFIKKIFSVCFFWAVLKFADTWLPAIIDSLVQIGTRVSGSSVTPDGILADGIETALTIFAVTKDKGLLDSITYSLTMVPVALGIYFCFLWAAIQLLVTLIESYLVLGAGAIMLGLGGSRWTTEFTSKYIQYAFGVGIKLMVIYLIVGVGKSIGTNLVINQDSAALIESGLYAFAQAAIFAILVTKSGSIASGMMSGAPALNASDAAATGMAALAGGVSLGAGLAGAGKMGANAAFGAIGGAQAVSAGMKKAQELGFGGLKGAGAGFGMAGAAMAREIVGSFGGGVKESMAAKLDQTAGARAAKELLGSLGGGMVPVSPSAGADAGPSASGSDFAGSPPTSGGSDSGQSSASSSSAGNASSASIGGAQNTSSANNAGQAQKPSWHQRAKGGINEAKGFILEDRPGASINIPMNHVE